MAAELYSEADFKAVEMIRGIFDTENAKKVITPEMEVRYIRTFIENNKDTWAEIMMMYPESREHFKEYKQTEIEADGTSWLFSDNFFD